MYGDKWTLTELVVSLGSNLDDSGATPRWSATLKASAIREAIRAARGYWWDERIGTQDNYDDDDFRYALPVYCSKVVSVWFEPLDTTLPRYEIPANWWHQEGTELVFTKSFSKYSGQQMYIHYLAYPGSLLTLSSTVGTVASATTKVLSAAAETFITKGVRAGDVVIISESGYAGNGTYYVDAVTSETQLTLDRAPGTIVTGTLDFNVALYTDMPYTYLMYFSMAWLYEVSARNKPGRDINDLLKLSSYYRTLAGRDLEQKARTARSMRRY